MTIYCINALKDETKGTSNVNEAMLLASQILKISGDCRKIKLQNVSILRYYSSIVLPTRVCIVINCSKLLFTHFP